MDKLFPSAVIYLSQSDIPKAGRGVFARKAIKKGEIIEVCPVFVLPKKDYRPLKQTAIRNYHFMWGKTTAAICFGWGSFYNHSYKPNATYIKQVKEKMITFSAIKDIAKDEEITVNYNYGNPEDKSTLWMKDIPPAE